MTKKVRKRKKTTNKAVRKLLPIGDLAEASTIRAEELQREIDHANEIIAKLERELTEAKDRIAELEVRKP